MNMKKALMMSTVVLTFASTGLYASSHDSESDTESPQNGDAVQDEGHNGAGDIDHTQVFMDLDNDGDGILAPAEAEMAADDGVYPDLMEQFDRLDTDGDGVLTQDEFEHFEPRSQGNN